VIIPTYNRADLVSEAIGSVLAQTYRDFEIVVCDDGSTDDTPTRVAEFGSAVRYLRFPHRGSLGATRNRGIHAARGEWIAFLDDDDLWEPAKLARQFDLVDREPLLDFVYSDRRVLSIEGKLSPPVHTPTSTAPSPLLDLVLNGHMPCICSVMARGELLRRVNGFDEAAGTGEDLDIMLRLGGVACAAGVAEPLVLVRRRRGSLSEGAGPLTFEHAIRILQRWLRQTAVSAPERRLGARMLANLHRGHSQALCANGDMEAARKAAWQAVQLDPLRRASWALLIKSR
jgi:glycosyltransferase involved in cell wall biosynthesis